VIPEIPRSTVETDGSWSLYRRGFVKGFGKAIFTLKTGTRKGPGLIVLRFANRYNKAPEPRVPDLSKVAEKTGFRAVHEAYRAGVSQSGSISR
jgi:hypothetical protein